MRELPFLDDQMGLEILPIGNEHVDHISENVVQEHRCGRSLQRMKISNLDPQLWNSPHHLPQQVPFSFATKPASRYLQGDGRISHEQRDLEGFCVYNRVDEHDFHHYYVVHETKDGVVCEVGYGSIARDNAHTYAHQLPREYQVPVDNVQHQDVQLLTTQGDVDLLNTSRQASITKESVDDVIRLRLHLKSFSTVECSCPICTLPHDIFPGGFQANVQEVKSDDLELQDWDCYSNKHEQHAYLLHPTDAEQEPVLPIFRQSRVQKELHFTVVDDAGSNCKNYS